MTAKDAINALKNQKKKLNESSAVLHDNLWLSQTKDYIISFLPNHQNLQLMINSFHAIDPNVKAYNGGKEKSETEDCIERLNILIDNCIEAIQVHGIEQKNFLSRLTDNQVKWLLGAVGTAILFAFSIGEWVGKHESKSLDTIIPKQDTARYKANNQTDSSHIGIK